jgi:hypothetical protein
MVMCMWLHKRLSWPSCWKVTLSVFEASSHVASCPMEEVTLQWIEGNTQLTASKKKIEHFSSIFYKIPNAGNNHMDLEVDYSPTELLKWGSAWLLFKWSFQLTFWRGQSSKAMLDSWSTKKCEMINVIYYYALLLLPLICGNILHSTR